MQRIGRDLPMQKIIDILFEEHQNIEKLLLVLERELDVFDRGGRPGYEILQTIIQYLGSVPADLSQKTDVIDCGAPGPMPLQEAGDSHGHEMYLQKFVRLVGFHEP